MSYQTDQRHGAARAASATHAWIWAIVTLGYMLPWAIAASRGARNSAGIFWLNLLAGWTIIGWVAALVMAAQRHQQLVPSAAAPSAAATPAAAAASTCANCGQPITFAEGYGWGHPHSQSPRCDDQVHTAAPEMTPPPSPDPW